LLLALLIANLLSRPRLRAGGAFRMAVLIPNATSVAAVGIIFLTLYKDSGVINWALGLVGIDPLDWHGEQWSYWVAVSSMVDWRWTGYNALILLSGMLAIPRDLYESAAIDGAGAWRQFRSVTFPLLRPTFLFVSIVSIIGGLQLFAEPVIYTYGYTVRGGTSREVQTLAMYVYENSIDTPNFAGYGAAVSWSMFILIVMASAGNYLLVRRVAK
jgi:cellobiose transport system permease protein